MSTRQIHIFISHAWAYSNHYNILSDWLFNSGWSIGQASLDFRDYSVPKHDPIHNTNNDTQLKNANYDKIIRSHVIVIPTGMYANYSKWIKKEIKGSTDYGKPILAVNPNGQQRVPGVVAENADEQVGCVVNGIWKLYNA